MTDLEWAMAIAIGMAKRRKSSEVEQDDLLLGCLQAVSRFGVSRLGRLSIDLEPYGVRWWEAIGQAGADGKVAYAATSVDVLDHAARLALVEGANRTQIEHLLAAFSGREEGLMLRLQKDYGFTGADWRAALVDRFEAVERGVGGSEASTPQSLRDREYLTPEEAAELLGVHVQTLRAYIRSGKLPALRIAGERVLRIRREELEKLLQPSQNEG